MRYLASILLMMSSFSGHVVLHLVEITLLFLSVALKKRYVEVSMISSFSGHVVLHLVEITLFVSFSCFKEALCRGIHQINDDDC